MIKIHIYSNNEIRGPFDIDEINFLLRAKKFSPSDHGCIPGGKKWQRLDSEFFSELGISVNEQEEPKQEKEVRNSVIGESLESAAGIAGSFFKKAKTKLKSENLSGKLDGLVDKVKFLPKNLVSGEMIRVQSRSGESEPMTVREVNGLIQTGVFELTNLAWMQGMEKWEPLSSFCFEKIGVVKHGASESVCEDVVLGKKASELLQDQPAKGNLLGKFLSGVDKFLTNAPKLIPSPISLGTDEEEYRTQGYLLFGKMNQTSLYLKSLEETHQFVLLENSKSVELESLQDQVEGSVLSTRGKLLCRFYFAGLSDDYQLDERENLFLLALGRFLALSEQERKSVSQVALSLLIAKCKKGEGVGQKELEGMKLVCRSLGFGENSSKYLDFLEEVAESGLPDAQFEIGQVLDSGVKVGTQRSNAEDWFKRAAEQGHPQAEQVLRLRLAQKKLQEVEYLVGSSHSTFSEFRAKLVAYLKDNGPGNCFTLLLEGCLIDDEGRPDCSSLEKTVPAFLEGELKRSRLVLQELGAESEGNKRAQEPQVKPSFMTAAPDGEALCLFMDLFSLCPDETDLHSSLQRENLTKLNLYGCPSHANLDGLSGLTNLEILYMGGCSSRANIDCLSGLTNLRSLNLGGSKSLTNIDSLSSLTNLAELDLMQCESLLNIDSLSGLRNLNVIGLYECKSLTNIDSLSGLTSLKSLSLGGCSSLLNIDGLSELTNLEKLYVYNCSSLKNFDGLRNLTSLSGEQKLFGCKSLVNIDGLSGLKNITVLHLGYSPSLANINGLSGLTNLTELKLSGCEALRDVDALSGLTQLTRLDLSSCKSLGNLDGLKNLGNLEELDLIRCKSLENLDALRSLANLTELRLGGCDLLTNLDALKGLSKLRKFSFDLPCDLITENQLDELGKALPDCEIEISKGAKLGFETANALAQRKIALTIPTKREWTLMNCLLYLYDYFSTIDGKVDDSESNEMLLAVLAWHKDSSLEKVLAARSFTLQWLIADRKESSKGNEDVVIKNVVEIANKLKNSLTPQNCKAIYLDLVRIGKADGSFDQGERATAKVLGEAMGLTILSDGRVL